MAHRAHVLHGRRGFAEYLVSHGILFIIPDVLVLGEKLIEFLQRKRKYLCLFVDDGQVDSIPL